MAAYLTYALLNDKLVNICDSRVNNGFSCNCICPECGEELNARNNAIKKEKHFAHKGESYPNCGYESAIHLLIKKVIIENPSIYLPDYYIEDDIFRTNTFIGRIFHFDRVEVEVTKKDENNRVKVDAIGYNKERQLHIEFAKTHFVDNRKLKKIEELKLDCIEVDISNLSLDEEKIKNFLINRNSPIYWLSTHHLDEMYKLKLKNSSIKFKKEIEQKIENTKRKLEKYERISDVKVKQIDYDSISFCPAFLNQVKSKLFQRHMNNKIIQNILNGAKWDGQFECRRRKGKYIKVNETNVWIYPPDQIMNNLTIEEKDLIHSFYSGLNIILREYEVSVYGSCKGCKYNVEIIEDFNCDYTVCSYK